jgi:hypothetical protein
MSSIKKFLNFRSHCPLCNEPLELFINSSNNKCIIDKHLIYFTAEYQDLSYHYKININTNSIKIRTKVKQTQLDKLLILFFYKLCKCSNYHYSSNKITVSNNVIQDPIIFQEQFFTKSWIIISSFKENETVFFSRNKHFSKISTPLLEINSQDDLDMFARNFMFI